MSNFLGFHVVAQTNGMYLLFLPLTPFCELLSYADLQKRFCKYERIFRIFGQASNTFLRLPLTLVLKT